MESPWNRKISQENLKGIPKKPYGNAYEAIRETEMSHRPRESLAPYGNPQVSKGNLKGIRKVF